MNHHPSPTDLPRGDRRTVRVVGGTIPPRPEAVETALLAEAGTTARPGTVEAVLLSAARVIARNGIHEDYVEDPFNRRHPQVPMFVRPMSVVGAIRYAATGHPQHTSTLADTAIKFLALSIDGGPVWQDLLSLECHIDAWSAGVTAADAVALLELVATAPERAA